MRAFLTVVIGAILLGGCAAKQNAASGQAVIAQEDKDRAACLEQALNKGTNDENKKAFASCMKARGYNEDKPYSSETTEDAGKPLVTDASTMARESSPGLAATEAYERAVADYKNCILDHTANLSACEKQRAIMNANSKVRSRLPASESDKIINVER